MLLLLSRALLATALSKCVLSAVTVYIYKHLCNTTQDCSCVCDAVINGLKWLHIHLFVHAHSSVCCARVCCERVTSCSSSNSSHLSFVLHKLPSVHSLRTSAHSIEAVD
jgi:hypothetical protein